MSKFTEIEKAFAGLKKRQSPAELTTLSHQLTSEFKKVIRCSVLDANIPLDKFVMSTTPDTTTLDKVCDYASDNSSKVATIVAIWQGSNKWTLEINKPVLDLLSAKELTALACHEVWHVIYSDRAVKRIQDGLLFAINTSKVTRNAILTSQKFKRVLRIPGLISCQLIFNKKEMATEAMAHKKYIEKEMKADTFAAENGYRAALIDAITKLETAIGSASSSAANIATLSSARVLGNLAERKEALARTQLTRMKSVFHGTALEEAIDTVYNDWFDSSETSFNEMFDENGEYTYSIPYSLYEESGFFAKRLEPIQRNQIDYAWVKAESIRTETDKMMILSYVDSKLELCEWYLTIADDAKLSKRYKLPHTKQELIKIRLRLESVREKIMNTSLRYANGYNDQYGKDVIVYYPNGYEG